MNKEPILQIESNGELLTTLSFDQINVLDILPLEENKYHILIDNIAYHAELVSLDDKEFVIKIGNKTHAIQIKDQLDILIDQLGFSSRVATQINEIKAPMPGLVLEVMVEPGQIVKKGDKLLLLEAMKMENIIKSPSDAVISRILIKKGMAVDKNQILILLN